MKGRPSCTPALRRVRTSNRIGRFSRTKHRRSSVTHSPSAGDLNGDGYQDLVVSAYLYSAGQASEGAVFAYHGSPTGPSPTADWMAEGDQASAFFGWAVDGVGDVNGDGFDDIVIGARYYDDLRTDEGAAFLYLGSAAGLQPSPAWRVTGGVDRVGMGYAVAGAGDVNGDGFDDVVVSAALMEPMENEGYRLPLHGILDRPGADACLVDRQRTPERRLWRRSRIGWRRESRRFRRFPCRVPWGRLPWSPWPRLPLLRIGDRPCRRAQLGGSRWDAEFTIRSGG